MLGRDRTIVAAEVYGLDRGEFEFILSTFPLAARYETQRWGGFRSGRLALEAFDQLRSREAGEVPRPAGPGAEAGVIPTAAKP